VDNKTMINDQVFTYYSRLARVKEHVEHNLDGDLSLAAVAGVAGMERGYFSRFFRQKTGVRFSNWVASLRVQRAKDLMRSANRSITRVAYSVGFRDVRTFERTFKRDTRMTPSAFKKLVRPS